MKSISFYCLILTLLLGFVYAKDEYIYALFDKDKAASVKDAVLNVIMQNKDTYEDKKKFEEEKLNFWEVKKGSAFDVGDTPYVRPDTDLYPIYLVYVNPKIIEKIKAVPGVILLDKDNGKVFNKYSELYENKKPDSATVTTANSTTATSATATNASTNNVANNANNANSNDTNNASNNASNNTTNNTAPVNNNTANNVNNSITNGNSTVPVKPISATSGVSSNTVFKISNVLIAIYAIYFFL
ncbi:hypothetical protein PIROE2DRAFT_9665 [Piromyces sp. E2]|nr:hypothetical protein PIROE2DRAFT_9665 [Piromyces sp. E2]|eukprot:OUM63727.1 hypothetical protein PIROE2DRAFT_9665 [Piromyces sp. E2]